MAEIVTFPFRAPRLPHRLLDDGWWLAREPEKPSAIDRPPADARAARVIPLPTINPRKAHEH